MLLKGFDETLRQAYYFDEIRRSTTHTLIEVNALNTIVMNDTNSVSIEVNELVQEIKSETEAMVIDLEKPLAELCDYATGNNEAVDDSAISALDSVHEQINKLIDTVRDDLLADITGSTLIDTDLEDQLRTYIKLIATILMVLIICSGTIPIILFGSFACWRFYANRQSNSSDINTLYCCKVRTICCLRIIYIPLMTMMMLLILVGGLLHGVDLVAHGTCQTVHQDQPFLVSILIGA